MLDSRMGRRGWLLPLVVLLLVVPAGIVGGSALRVVKGNAESGFGSVIAAPPVGSWWTLLTFTFVNLPNGLGAASTNVSHPVNLSGTAPQSFAVGTAPAGTAGVVFAFQLGTSAPNATELELRFTIAASGAASTLTVYLETPAGPPASPQVERLYVAAPSGAFTGFTLQGFDATSQRCTAVGVCP